MAFNMGVPRLVSSKMWVNINGDMIESKQLLILVGLQVGRRAERLAERLTWSSPLGLAVKASTFYVKIRSLV